MGKPPAFQLYAADFYMDTLTWDADDIGVYFCLLMAEWVNGPLEDDTRKLAKIAKKTHQKFIKNWTKISQKFSKTGTGTIINLRLEDERKKQEEFRENAKESGRKGGLRTQKKRGKQSSEPLSEPLSNPSSENQALQSSSSLKDIIAIPPISSGQPVDNSQTETPKPPDQKEPENQKPEPQNTHGERWTEKLSAELNALGDEIRDRYGLRYHGRVQVWVGTNYGSKNPTAMVHCLKRLIQERQKGTVIPLPEAYLDAILNGNGKHPGENGKFEAEESAQECDRHKGEFVSLKDLVPPSLRSPGG